MPRNKNREDALLRRERGKYAFREGKGQESNPYPEGSPSARHWREGWGQSSTTKELGPMGRRDYDQRKKQGQGDLY